MVLIRKADDFPELSDTDRICDIAFAVDIMTHMNELNVKQQGKDQFVHEVHANLNTFKAKLRLFSRQQSFTHFPILATLKEAPQHAKKYRKPLDGPAIGSLLLEKFDKALQLVSCPFSHHRSQFTDEHCRSVLRIAATKLTPDCGALAKKGNQQRCSH